MLEYLVMRERNVMWQKDGEVSSLLQPLMNFHVRNIFSFTALKHLAGKSSTHRLLKDFLLPLSHLLLLPIILGSKACEAAVEWGGKGLVELLDVTWCHGTWSSTLARDRKQTTADLFLVFYMSKDGMQCPAISILSERVPRVGNFQASWQNARAHFNTRDPNDATAVSCIGCQWPGPFPPQNHNSFSS
ncbi:hypothetical protein AVEN_35024-1 [Araneus ventricosus]|uniref:Uncharacterized protein n=1 Tax=Araneus ventricosus TaxID=182803 RepID=A0A4Y2I0Q3_ARAVE|nr:hypothetical protein AVEN_35024-1 [Araneus ventricosus]